MPKAKEVKSVAVIEPKPFAIDDLASYMTPSLKDEAAPVVYINGETIEMVPCDEPDAVRSAYRDISFGFSATPCQQDNGYIPQMGCVPEKQKSWFKAKTPLIDIYVTEGSDVRIPFNDYNSYISEKDEKSLIIADGSKLVIQSGWVGGPLVLANSLCMFNNVSSKGENVITNSTLSQTGNYCFFEDAKIHNTRLNQVTNLGVIESEIFNVSMGQLGSLDLRHTSLSAGNTSWWNGSERISVALKDQRVITLDDLIETYYLGRENGVNIDIQSRLHYGVFTGLVPVPFNRGAKGQILLGGTIEVTKKDLETVLQVHSWRSSDEKATGLYKTLAIVFTGYNPDISHEMVVGTYGESFTIFIKSIISRLDVFEMVEAVKRAN